MSNRFDTETFGSIKAGLNFDFTRVSRHIDRAVYIRPTTNTSTPASLSLADAKGLHAHLGKLIDQIEAGIEAQKPKLPTAFGSVAEIADRTWVRLGYPWWTDNEGHHKSQTALQREDFTVLRDGI